MPRIKSHLNGADITGYLTLRTLLSKMVAIIFVVSTSLPCGKDGPMVHIGACLATLLSQHDYWFMKHLPELKQPHALRTWVSMGAAAGMCAAFNAPMGGILYCFEDVSTHWNRTLSWRAFLCAMTVVVAARVFMELPRELCGDSQSFQCKAVKMHTFVYGLDFLADNDYLAVSDGGLFWYMILSVLGGLIGSALVGTFLGVFLAYGIVEPFASRFTQVIDEEGEMPKVVKQIIIGTLHGHPMPLIIEAARACVSHHNQPTFAEVFDGMRGK
jgi:H+/Cl- antiporter ClcA